MLKPLLSDDEMMYHAGSTSHMYKIPPESCLDRCETHLIAFLALCNSGLQIHNSGSVADDFDLLKRLRFLCSSPLQCCRGTTIMNIHGTSRMLIVLESLNVQRKEI